VSASTWVIVLAATPLIRLVAEFHLDSHNQHRAEDQPAHAANADADADATSVWSSHLQGDVLFVGLGYALCAAAFPSCVRSILTEIYLCHACSCHEMLSGNAAAGCWWRSS
jgi:hypothetical protein